MAQEEQQGGQLFEQDPENALTPEELDHRLEEEEAGRTKLIPARKLRPDADEKALVKIPENLDSLARLDRQEIDRHLANMDRVITHTREMALASTLPSDWTLNAHGQGSSRKVIGTLRSSGAKKVLQYYLVQWREQEPAYLEEDEREVPVKDAKGEPTGQTRTEKFWVATARGIARSYRTMQEQTFVARRKSYEKFAGREGDKHDLCASAETLLFTKAAKFFASANNVPEQVLKDKYELNTDDCFKGHGFGTSAARGAQELAPEEVKAGAEKIWKTCLRCMDGDEQQAKQMFKEITKGKNFAGFTEWQRLTKDWQIEQAEANLKKHPMFSPSSRKPTPQKGKPRQPRLPGEEG